MKHFYVDKYSYLDSPVHRIRPVIKVVASFAFLIYVIISPEKWWNYSICFLGLLFLTFISKIPFSFVFKRALVILPFLILVIIFIPFFNENGIKIAGLTFIKSFLSIITLILLTSTTKFSALLRGLSSLGVPRIIILILSFMYRYFFVLVDELEKMLRAVKLRSFKNNRIKTFSILANIVGVLFIRSYERSERVYNAMSMRGFDGEIKKL